MWIIEQVMEAKLEQEKRQNKTEHLKASKLLDAIDNLDV